jgi:hypothetical protein
MRSLSVIHPSMRKVTSILYTGKVKPFAYYNFYIYIVGFKNEFRKKEDE